MESLYQNLKVFYDNYPKEKYSSNYINLWRWIIVNPISIICAYIFSIFKIKPNHVTILALIFGLYALYNFLNSFFVLGALILNFAYLLDCIDGHLARLYKTTSKKGQYLDDISGIIVWSISWFSIGIGLYHNNYEGYLNFIFFNTFDVIFDNSYYIVIGGLACIFSELRTLISFKFIQVKNSKGDAQKMIKNDYKDPNLSFIYILFRNITGVGGFILPIIAIAAFFNFLDILIFIYSIIYFLTFVLYCISYYRKLN